MEAHILKIKDENGNWVSIPAIKGEKGEPGESVDAYTKAETDELLLLKQNTEDETLTTEDKTIVGAINELNAKPSMPELDEVTITTNSDDELQAVYLVGLTASIQELNYTDGVTSNIQTQLGNKANSSDVYTKSEAVAKADLSQVYPIIDTYISGTSGYRIWSDGYCEQWGIIPQQTSGNYTVSFLKTFKDTNYIVTGSLGYDSSNTATFRAISFPFTKSVNSFTTRCDSNYKKDWVANGYLAEGEY